MAKTTYPYVIAWRTESGRLDLWTKKGAWGAEFRFDIMKLFRTLATAEAEAFRIVAAHAMVGEEVVVCRFDDFIRRMSTHLVIENDYRRRFVLRHARRWMARRSSQKYFLMPRDPMDHGHNSMAKMVKTERGGREYRCTWCNVKVGLRREKVNDWSFLR